MTVYAWSTTAATNATADGTINWAEGQLPSTVNDSARAMMARWAAWLDQIGGTVTYGGSSNAYTATSPSGHALTAYAAGNLYALKANHTNTGPATINIDGLGAKSIVTPAGAAMTASAIVSGGVYLLVYDGTSFQIANSLPAGAPRSYLAGYALSNNAGGTTAIDVAAGVARDSTNVIDIVLASAVTAKTLGTAWAAGNSQGMLDTGTVGNNTYHVYAIRKDSDGSVDVLASLSVSAPTMPAGYTYFRRIGSIIRSSGAILLFTQIGDSVYYNTPIADVNVTIAANTARTARTLTVPTGVVVQPIGYAAIGMQKEDDQAYVYVTTPGLSDTLPSTSAATASVWYEAYSPGAVGHWGIGNLSCHTNTSAQVNSRTARATTVGGTVFLLIVTHGYVDSRGRDS